MEYLSIMKKMIVSGVIFVLITVFPSSVTAQDQVSNDNMAITNPAKNHVVKTITLPDGRIIEARNTPSPPNRPLGFEANVVALPVPHQTEATNFLLDVPAFDWSFGCSATSAAMIAGYYDRHGYTHMYTGPTNGGLMPLDNSSWPDWNDSYGDPRHQCPLSATHNGLDGRSTYGHVDDYWFGYGDSDDDPFIQASRPEHTYGECTGDFMKTNQSTYGNSDGSTTFYNWNNGAPLYYSEMETNYIDHLDGGYGIKLFYESRGYNVTEMYNQYIDELGLTYGFAYAQYCAEIDAGRPVMIHVQGHTMVGIGYNDALNLMYIHDTWDYYTYTMTWGEEYAGMLHYGVTIVHLQTSDIIFTNGADPSLNFVQTAPSPPQANWPFAQFRLDSDVEGAMLNEITVGLSGSYSGLDGEYPFSLFASNSNNFLTATAIGSDTSESNGYVTFTALNDAPLEGSRYYWITADLSANASGTINGSINDDSAIDIMNATFNTSSNYGNLNTGEDASLPVTLSSFTCYAVNDQIKLEWTTESEINNDGFIIERAMDNEGPYMEIASYKYQNRLKGQGTVSYATNYNYYDNNIESGITYYYTLISKDINGSLNTYGPVSTKILDLESIHYNLEQNYPNPFNASTLIKFSLPEAENVVITVYNVSGQKITVLVDKMMDKGNYQITFEADHLASGIYLYEIIAGKYRQLRKMIVVR
jgi:hypothetical protein